MQQLQDTDHQKYSIDLRTDISQEFATNQNKNTIWVDEMYWPIGPHCNSERIISRISVLCKLIKKRRAHDRPGDLTSRTVVPKAGSRDMSSVRNGALETRPEARVNGDTSIVR